MRATLIRLREYLALRPARQSDQFRDQVSDAILDACLAEDPLSKVCLTSPFRRYFNVVRGSIDSALGRL